MAKDKIDPAMLSRFQVIGIDSPTIQKRETIWANLLRESHFKVDLPKHVACIEKLASLPITDIRDIKHLVLKAHVATWKYGGVNDISDETCPVWKQVELWC
jgi:hypothetical protein